jgi:alkanesulfonate monooxygenase SsuD/methylene tetrahydromethanopterin reductase-like flavin-dependent oxidoreductase (luciferase family)
MAKLKLGIDLHNRASVFMPEQGLDYDLNRLIDLAVLCEELGFYSVSVGDSLLSKPRWRSIPTMAAMAAKTSRIKITSHILMPHLYNNPVLLAQELATLDVIAEGRVVLGCGIGGGKSDLVELEHRLCGVPRSRRGRAFDECLVLLKRLWTEEEVTHDGEFWQYEGVRLGLKPHQKPHPPIWVAAGTYLSNAGTSSFGTKERSGDVAGFRLAPAPIDRVARLGDGWLTNKCTPEELKSGLERVRGLATEKYDREAGAIQSIMNAGVFVNPDVEAAYREVKWYEDSYHAMPVPEDTIRRWTIFGDPDDCIKQMEPFADAGVDVFNICIRARDMFAQVRAIAKDVLPAFS